MKPKIVVRADGNNLIGMGHITRCLHFVENLKGKFYIIFFFKKNPRLKEYLNICNYNSFELDSDITLKEEIDIVTENSSNLLILDIRDEDNKYYKTYCNAYNKTLQFDDSSQEITIFSDLYLNYNLYSENIKLVLKNKDCKLYLGPRYYILNPVFKRFENYKRTFDRSAKNILITMGGADPKNLTIKIIKALIKLENIQINIILGKLFQKFDEIEQIKNKFSSKISIFPDIKNMEEFMLKNDLIITTGGNTSFEAAFVGIPGILINQIELQNQNGIKYDEKSIFINLGLGEKIHENEIKNAVINLIQSKNLRKNLSKNGKTLNVSSNINKVIEEFIN